MRTLAAGVVVANAMAGARAAPAVRPSAPEPLLIDIYKELSGNNLRDAQAKADALVAAFPNFRLGQLIRGDLLLMHTRPVASLGAASQGDVDKLKDLRAEASVRLNAGRERPAPGLLPRAILQMRPDQRHALLVDAGNSRLYMYENRNDKITLVADMYVSQGKLGINKLKEGDFRTPVGVYYIVSRLRGWKLPDMYGKGALPLNYPNEWDRINGRGGTGIWVHGTPSDIYSRPPLATDGCVVLTNDDLRKVSRLIDIGKTPVIISEQLEFVTKARSDSDREAAKALVERWRLDVESLDEARLRLHYSARFKSSQGENAAAWIVRQRFLPGAKKAVVILTEPSYFRYPGNQEMIVSNFTQTTIVGKFRSALRKQQYWAKEGLQWKIVSESNQ